MIIEYKLQLNSDHTLVTPSWVENGGYVPNPDTHTLMGFTQSESNREYYLPDSVVVLTTSEAKARAIAIAEQYPMSDPDGNVMTDAEIEVMIQSIIEDNDIS